MVVPPEMRRRRLHGGRDRRPRPRRRRVGRAAAGDGRLRRDVARPRSTSGPAPGAAINDIALRGSRVVAVGDDGMICAATTPGPPGAASTRRRPQAHLGGHRRRRDRRRRRPSAGEILVGPGRDVDGRGRGRGGAVTSVAAVADPDVGRRAARPRRRHRQRRPGQRRRAHVRDAAGPSGRGHATVVGVAWSGVPARSLLSPAASGPGYFETVGPARGSPARPGSRPRGRSTPAGQSVGYVLGADGRLARTLSAGPRARGRRRWARAASRSAEPRGSRRP